MKAISPEQTAKLLKEIDNVLVLMHKSPDGDAVGCGYALCMVLRSMGKKANPLCGDEIPPLFDLVTSKLEPQEFEPENIVSVDLATEKLLSGKALEYADRVDLCIDHHSVNSGYAKQGYVDPHSASCAEILKRIFDIMGIKPDKDIADALFMGVSTDTGCFKYSNVTPQTHRIAAELMEWGADSTGICRRFFDTKSRTKLALERLILDSLLYAADGRIAFVCITRSMMEQSGATQGDTDGVAGITKQIEGVDIGITMREKENGEFRISVRTNGQISAADICTQFGGGGHRGAAGCSIFEDMEKSRDMIISACEAALERTE